MTQEEVDVNEAQVGRVLHFVIEQDGAIKCRPAIVLQDIFAGEVNLVLFYEGDGPQLGSFQSNVLPDHVIRNPKTWHWPRECKKLT